MVFAANGKITFWWHWRKTPISKFNSLKPMLTAGDPTSFSVDLDAIPFGKTYASLNLIKMSLDGWKNTYELYPVDDKIKEWQFAFKDLLDPQNYLMVCSIVLEGPVRVLRGPKIKAVFGFDLSGRGIELKEGKSAPRSENSSLYPLI